MCIALRQCAAYIWKYVGPFTIAFTMINISGPKSTYDHSTIKGVHHACVLHDTVVPLYIMYA